MKSYVGAEDLNKTNFVLEGFELFGSTKRKVDLPLGSEYDSYCPNKVNYSIPHPTTRSSRARIEESFSHDENVLYHTTNVLESKCPKY